MTHMYALVEVPPGTTDESVIDAAGILLEPHKEEYDDAKDELTGWWDWYSFGGRFTGRLDGFDPQSDLHNIEQCFLCAGTGTRPDGINGPGGCNACDGAGVRLKFPSYFRPHPGDIAYRREIREDGIPYTLVTQQGVTHKETFNDEKWRDSSPDHVKHWESIPADTLLAVIDYHD